MNTQWPQLETRPKNTKEAFRLIYAAMGTEIGELVQKKDFDAAILLAGKMQKLEKSEGVTVKIDHGHFRRAFSSLTIDDLVGGNITGRIESATTKPGAMTRQIDDPSASERH